MRIPTLATPMAPMRLKFLLDHRHEADEKVAGVPA
jgi:hypothetical protein